MSVFFTRAALFYNFTTFWGPPLFFFFPRVPRGCLPKTGGGVWKLARKNSFPRFYNVSIGRTDGQSSSPRNREIGRGKGFFPSLQDDGFPCRRSGSLPPISPFPFFSVLAPKPAHPPSAHSRHFSSGRNHHIHPFSLQTGFPFAQALPLFPAHGLGIFQIRRPDTHFSLWPDRGIPFEDFFLLFPSFFRAKLIIYLSPIPAFPIRILSPFLYKFRK